MTRRPLRSLLGGLLLTAALLAACETGLDEPADPEPVEDPTDAPTPEDEAEATPTPEPSPEPTPEPDEEPAAQPRPLDELDLALTPVADADEPTAGAVSPEGVLHIAERGGLLRPLEDGGLGSAVVDLSASTTTDSERGLLGVAFDDERVYLSYTDNDGDTVVERRDWQDGGVVDGTTETLLTLAQPFANHNGGDLALGPDGALWFGLGDGGGGGDPLEAGQDLTTPLGALLRLDPDTGEAAEGNPDLGDDADPRIWAFGLRNPWRFSFDEATGDLWIADVGQDEREEVNWLPAEDGEPGGAGAGANLGWNAMEGTLEFAGPEPEDHWPPIHEYETRVDGCAITGGVVYRGTAVDGLEGAYLYSDFCDGGVRGLRHDDGEVTEQRDFDVDGASSVVSFAVDADGEVYLLTFGDGVLRLDEAG